MTRPVAACPNCSAPVEFRWSSAVQTVCGHCRSVVVRHDVDLKAVGVVADLPLSGSPIQIGTRGRFQGDAFTVTGRIVYEYEHGTWNEWHVAFADDSSGWLSDAQAEYAVSRVVQKPASLPASADLEIGQTFAFGDLTFQLTTLTRARYRGVEGELPFEYWDKDEVLFADLRSADGHFATLDYSETPPLLFLGAFVQFDELELKDLRAPDTGPQAKTAGFNCRNCGAAIELRAVELTKSVACTSCAAIQDPNDPNVLILQEAQARERYVPKIPLGTRGTLRGHAFEVIGYQYRYIVVDDEQYGWDEYLLYNREQGFRYLSEYQGHWNDITTLRVLPAQTTSGGRPGGALRRQDVQVVPDGVGDHRLRPRTVSVARAGVRRGWRERLHRPAAAAVGRAHGSGDHLVARRVHDRRRHLEGVRPARRTTARGGRLCQPALAPQGQGRVVLDDLCRAGAAGDGLPASCGRYPPRASRCLPAATSSSRPPSTRRLSPRRSG